MQSGTLSVDGCELYYEEAGAGPPVVLVHGAGAFAGLFAGCVAALERSHRVLAYDRRSCARSVAPPVRDLRIHARDLGRLIDERIGESATIVGWSAGCVVALELAIAAPDRVRALVLAEPPMLLRRPRPLALGAMARWEIARRVRGAEAGARSFYRWVSQYRGRGENAFDAYPAAWQSQMLANAPSLFAEILVGSGALGERLRKRDLAALDLPVHVLLGDRSASVFGPAARWAAGVIPGSQLVDVAGAGHMLPTDSPDAVATAVARAS